MKHKENYIFKEIITYPNVGKVLVYDIIDYSENKVVWSSGMISLDLKKMRPCRQSFYSKTDEWYDIVVNLDEELCVVHSNSKTSVITPIEPRVVELVTNYLFEQTFLKG